uniref:ATP synthase complex subunit 8 n=1 Tax=Acanthodactylus boskianus TaxID=111507 RepID=A0A8A3WQL7_9SAUR|nr:ATP synthase F0 subunit 8 [Acanthodactylus boskianus]QTA72542.1 ATP synthase F0 subunit 8 [Acanthodactylus boskianus]
MPQLNPAPWFYILILVWLTLIMLFTKVLSNKTTTLPTQYQLISHSNFWHWPWP